MPAKFDWRAMVAGFAGSGAEYNASLAARAKIMQQGRMDQFRQANITSQIGRRDIENISDMLTISEKKTIKFEDDVLDGLQNQFMTQDDEGRMYFDIDGANALLQSKGAGNMVPAMLARYNEFIGAQNKRMTDEADRRATDAESFDDNANTDFDYSIKKLRTIIPNAVNYSKPITLDGKDGRMVSTEDGQMVFFSSQDLRDQQLSAHETAQLVQDQAQADATLKKPETWLNTYDEIRRRHDEKNAELAQAGLPQHPWTLGSETAWRQSMKRSGVAQGEIDPTDKEMIKAEIQVWQVRKKKFDESSLKMAELNKLESLYKLGLVTTEPGKKFELWMEQALAKAQLWTGADLGITPQNISDTGYKQTAQMIMMKLAYSNRADFMPGQLSNMENHKLAQMEISMDTSQEAALWLIAGIRADRQFQAKMLMEQKAWIKPTKGSMMGMKRTVWTVNRDAPDGAMVKVTVDNWEDYKDARGAAHMRARFIATKQYVDKHKVGRDSPPDNHGLPKGFSVDG